MQHAKRENKAAPDAVLQFVAISAAQLRNARFCIEQYNAADSEKDDRKKKRPEGRYFLLAIKKGISTGGKPARMNTE